jgi:spore maturation protein CgeB
VPLLIDDAVFRGVREADPDLVWVNQGEFIGPKLLQRIRTLAVPIVNYTNDDPFSGGRHNGWRFRLYLKAVPYYDLISVVRDFNIREARGFGARRVVRVFLSADEVAHRPRDVTPEDRRRYASDVAFIGTWMPERGPFIADLIRLGVPVSVWGDRWHKAREWATIEAHWRGPGVFDDRYSTIILSAKVVLGLVSKDNRDLHTQRTMEIPALGVVLCAERTSEHLHLYDDGTEALFWNSPAECASACRRLLTNEDYRQSVARRGRERLQQNGNYNEQVLTSILNALTGGAAEAIG